MADDDVDLAGMNDDDLVAQMHRDVARVRELSRPGA